MPDEQEPAQDPAQGPALQSLSRRHTFVRGEGVEFDRVAFFNDAVFAIAMTLLVVSIEPPDLVGPESDWSSLWQPLREQGPQIFSFFLAFVLLGRYWIAEHRFFSWLGRVDGAFIALTLVYLSFVAFLPFPTDLVGTHPRNPASVVVFAVVLSLISGLEWIMMRHAYGHGLLRVEMSPAAFRYASVASLTPVALFMISVPIAFVDTRLAMFCWLLSIPLGMVTDRVMSGAREWRD